MCIVFLIFIVSASYTQAVSKERPPHTHPSGPGGPGPKPPPPPSPKNPDNIKNYRGSRAFSRQTPLKVSQTKCSKAEDGSVCVEIKFNQNINPRSVKNTSITVNGKAMDENSRLSFSKKGDSLHFYVANVGDSLEIKIQDIVSYNGASIGVIRITTGVKTQ